MPVYKVPAAKVFDEVRMLRKSIELTLRGAMSINPKVVKSWADKLQLILPVLTVSETSDPYPHWDEEDRYLVLYRVLRQMRRAEQMKCPASVGQVVSWTIKMEAAESYKPEILEQMRTTLLDGAA